MQDPWVVGKKFGSFPSNIFTQPFQYFQIINMACCLSSWYKFIMKNHSNIKFANFVINARGRSVLYRIRYASAVRNALHTSWLLGVASRARLQLLFILLALRLNYTLNLISISQQVRLTVADKRTLAWQADKSARHPGGEKYQLRI